MPLSMPIARRVDGEENWHGGHPDDALREFEKCLELAKELFGDEPNSDTVAILQAIARLPESSGEFTRALVALGRALAVQLQRTGAKSWEVSEINEEIGRLSRLDKLGANRTGELARLRSSIVFVSTGNSVLGSAVCIDPRGLFITQARPLADLVREVTTNFEYDPKTSELIGLRTEYDRYARWELFVIVNPELPDQIILPARIVRTSKTDDLALIVASGGNPLPAPELARAHVPRTGSDVIALNHWMPPNKSLRVGQEPPFLRMNPSTFSTVRLLKDRPWILEFADAPAPGTSEGPLIDKAGRLVGYCIRGLPGTGLAYAIPARQIETLLGDGAILADNRTLAYQDRKREQVWTVPVMLTDPKRPDVSLEVAFVEGDSRRRFRSDLAKEAGKFSMRLVPVSPEAAEPVDLIVEDPRGKNRYRVEDRAVSVGPATIRLSELRSLEFAGQPRAVTADGRVLEGTISGLEGLRGQADGKLAEVETRSAGRIRVVYPPESIDPLAAEFVLRSREEILVREPLPIPIRVPRVELGGRFDVSIAPAARDPLAAPAPTEMAEDRVLDMEARIGAVAVGGGGRFLLLALLERDEAVVFDAFSRRIATRIPLLARDVLVAGAADAMLLVYPELGVIHRWDLRRMTLERTASLPIRGEVKAVTIGADSAGPMLVRWVERSSRAGFSRTYFSFIDPHSLKVLSNSRLRVSNWELKSENLWDMPEPGVARLPRYLDENGDLKLRASSRGDVFAIWRTDQTPGGFVTWTLRGGDSQVIDRHTDFRHLIPSQDGRSIFTGGGQRVDLRGELIGNGTKATPKPGAARPQNPPLMPPTLLVPSSEPAYFLDVDISQSGPSQVSKGEKASIRYKALGLERPLGTLDLPWDVPKPVPNPRPDQGSPRQPDDDQRFHWIPAANLLVVIPPTNDRLVLRHVRLKEMLERLGGNYLFVSSPRGIDVVLGRPFRGAIIAETGRGRATFTLMKGPPGLRLSIVGELQWDEPSGKPGDQVELDIEISNGAMRPVAETLVLRILSPGGTSR
jgi:hypothetical protein